MNALAKKLESETALTSADGFDSFVDEVEGEDSSQSLMQGLVLKFTNDWRWVTGEDDEVAGTREFIVVDVLRVVQYWQDGQVINEKTIVLKPHERYPDVKAKNEAEPRSVWQPDQNGNPRGPWQAAKILYLVEPPMFDRFTYPTSTVGGNIAVADLCDRIKWIRRLRAEKLYAVINLGHVFMPTRFGGRERPHLQVKRWVTFSATGQLVSADEPSKLAAPTTVEQSLDTFAGAKTVEPPTRKEELKDEVPY